MSKTTLDAGLTPKMQGQKFTALLAARLIASGYTVAVPEPDSGEDLWIGTPADKKTNVEQRTIFRAQVKGLFTFAETKKEKNEAMSPMITSARSTTRFLSPASFISSAYATIGCNPKLGSNFTLAVSPQKASFNT